MMASTALGIAWGLAFALPIAARARRSPARARTTLLASEHGSQRPTSRAVQWTSATVQRVPPSFGRVLNLLGDRRRRRAMSDVVAREMPVTVDLLAVAVGAGCTPFLAVDVAARWAPPTLAARLGEVRRACTLGRSFGDALDDLSGELPELTPLCDALLASEHYGAPVVDALLRLATEQRTALRRRAEARARTVPVRLLFPLVFLVLPAFGLLTVVPAVLGGLGGV
jgi:pilus assembly protein TadC